MLLFCREVYPLIEFKNVSFQYKSENQITSGIQNVSITIPKGQFVVLCGQSGCGKTTMIRLINGLIPHYYEGNLQGSVLLNANDISKQPLYETAKQVGSVFQNPRTQFFNVDTTSEITFACENFGMDVKEINNRLQTMNQFYKLDSLLNRNIFHLSGGQKQKIACASATILYPDVLVLDEPSSNLDASSIQELRDVLARLKEQGKTIIISEHRLYYVKELADRFLVMKDGQIQKDYSSNEFLSLDNKVRQQLGLRSLYQEDNELLEYHSREMFHLKDFQFAYKNQKPVLHIKNLELPKNEIVGIIGNNGAGKSTFVRCFCGLEKKCGIVQDKDQTWTSKQRLNQCFMVMQDVNHQLFTESVWDEVLLGNEGKESLVQEILQDLGLWEWKDSHPMSLSGGQKQRVAIASALVSQRDVLFFDEPTSGLDYAHMKEVAALLKKINQNNKSLYIVTHDYELLRTCCSYVLHFDNGKVIDQYALDKEGIQKLNTYFQI